MDMELTELTALSRKIDTLTAQVSYLTEQARETERTKANQSELMHDAMPVANDVMRLATQHLQEIQDYVQLDDLVRLLKKLIRHAPDLERLLDQVDSVSELAEIAGPMSKDAFAVTERVLDSASRKGYFAFARGGARLFDNIVTSFSEDDVRQLGDNIVLILRTVKEMTQPEVMNFLRNTVARAEAVAEQDAATPVDISYRSLLGQMRDPDVRRGLALAMRMLSGLGGQSQ